MKTDFAHLLKILQKDRDFMTFVGSRKQIKLSLDQKNKIIKILSRIESKIPRSDSLAIDTISIIKDSIAHGIFDNFFPSQAQYISAVFLAGAAITRKDLSMLRPDLSLNLINARNTYLNIPGTTIPTGSGESSDTTLPTGAIIDPSIQNIINQYNSLVKKVNPNGKLANAIKSLLTDVSRPLLLSFELSSLDLDKIIARNNTLFKTETTKIDSIHIENKTNLSYAPNIADLKLKKLYCLKSQEEPDQMFIAGSSVALTNCDDIYKLVDNYFNNPDPTQQTLELQCEWTYTDFVLPSNNLYSMNTNDTPKVIDVTVFNQQIYHGFGPFMVAINIIEDDNAEYEAVQEVVSEIGEFAKVVQKTSQTISIGLAAGAITGPAAVATSALSFAAGCVALAADIVNAVIGIVNYFDENDLVGTIYINGDGDYSCATQKDFEETYKSEMVDSKSVSGNDMEYKLEWALCYSGMDTYQRNWEFIVDRNTTAQYHRSGGPFGSGHDKSESCRYGVIEQGMHILTGLISKNPTDANVYFIDGPRFDYVGGNQYKYAAVHWGCDLWKNIDFSITLEAIKFKKTL